MAHCSMQRSQIRIESMEIFIIAINNIVDFQYYSFVVKTATVLPLLQMGVKTNTSLERERLITFQLKNPVWKIVLNTYWVLYLELYLLKLMACCLFGLTMRKHW